MRKRAFEWYGKAALQGHKIAQYNLGVLSRNGWGTEKSNIESYKWYTIADKNGNGRAKRQLEILSNRMEPEAIRKADKLAKRFIRENKGCINN